MRELLLGAGNARTKKLWQTGHREFEDPVTLDIDPRCRPDVLWDLNDRPLPFGDGAFDEIHAYEVLEHIGQQGDWRGFFAEFSEYWRLLKPDGLLIFTVPKWDSPWCWGDPGHVRMISQQTLTFLSQEEYARQVGVTAMTDYRDIYRADFRLVAADHSHEHMALFALQKVA
jgi:SAM-dependent methyltransferase